MAVQARQTERSRQTDHRVAESAARAVRSVGVDQMALTRVAADAGFSSGAIYARCDDRSELIVLAWEKSFWPMLSAILVPLIDSVMERREEHIPEVMRCFNEASAPDAVPDLGSAMEVIVASRRDEVIGEVVQRDILGLLDDRGVGPSTDGAHRQAIVSAISTLFGASLLNSAFAARDKFAVDPTALINNFTRAIRTQKKPAHSPGVVRVSEPYQFPSTGDPIRDALIAATEYVIGRSGVHKATVSRIARRAGVSVGAIYGLYDNKDSLVADCMEVLFPPQSKKDAEDWSRVFTAKDQRAMITDILVSYMSDSMEQWRRFRLECFIAARHSHQLANQLSAFALKSRTAVLKAAAAASPTASITPDTGLSARASVLGLSVLEIVDPSIRRLDYRWIPIV